MKSTKMVVMNLLARKEWRHRCGHSRERRGWDEWKRSIDIYTVSCVKQIAGGKLLYNTGTPTLVLSDDLDVWDW